jgi:hypothetical protein
VKDIAYLIRKHFKLSGPIQYDSGIQLAIASGFLPTYDELVHAPFFAELFA